MSKNIDRILETIDVGLQQAGDDSYGEVQTGERSCVRCPLDAEADSDFCPACRAFMLGDREDDPAAVYTWSQVVTYDTENCRVDWAESARDFIEWARDTEVRSPFALDPDPLETALDFPPEAVRPPLGWRPIPDCPCRPCVAYERQQTIPDHQQWAMPARNALFRLLDDQGRSIGGGSTFTVQRGEVREVTVTIDRPGTVVGYVLNGTWRTCGPCVVHPDETVTVRLD